MMEKTKIAMHLEEESKPIKKMCEKLMDSVNHELDKGIENVDTKELSEAIDMIKDLYEAKKEMYEACYYKQIMEAMEKNDFEDEEEIMDEGRRGYRGRSRDSMGRFTSRGGRGRGGRRGYESSMMYDEDWEEMERMRDFDRSSGKMYYSRSGSSGSSSSGMSSGGSQGGMSSGMSGGSSSGGQSSGGSTGGSRGYSESGFQGGRDSREGRSGQSRRSYMESKEMGKDKQEKMKSLEEYMKELSSDVTEMISDASPEEKSMLKNKMSVLMQKIQ